MGEVGSRPYFLVGHSIGGVLAKEVLLRADRTYQRLRCKGVVFYGVPQLDELFIKSALFGIPNSEMRQFDRYESLQHYVDFQPLLEKIHTYCFIENMKTSIGDKKLMVFKRSAVDGAKASNMAIVEDADHFQVCRPHTKHDLTVKLLVHFIKSRF